MSSGKSEAVGKEFEEYCRKYPNKPMKRLTGYLKRFSKNMNYEEFGAQGYPADSGEAESAHKSVPRKRLKISGACRRKETLNPVSALRVRRAIGWWDDFWEKRSLKKADRFTGS